MQQMPRRLLTLCLIALAWVGLPRSYAYEAASIPFEWTSFTRTEVPLGDDEMSGPIPLPFSFGVLYDYPYLVPQATIYISSNGFLTFASEQSDGCTGQPQPCQAQELPTSASPNGLIAGYWEDLNPQAGGRISYGTVGTPPDRRFIVEFDDVPHAPSGHPVSFQIKLLESSRQVEIHCKSCPSDGGKHTQGIEGLPRPAFGGVPDAVCFTTNPLLNPTAGYNQKCRRQVCAGGARHGGDCTVPADCPGGTCTIVVGERNAASFSLTADAVRFTPPNNRAGLYPATPWAGPGNLIGLRYRFRLDVNEGPSGAPPGFKLVYLPTPVYDAPNFISGINRDTYLLNGFFYSGGYRYTDPVCAASFGLPPAITTVPLGSFRLQIPDYVAKGFTGARTDQPTAFPRHTSTAGIDGIAAAIGIQPQVDALGADGIYELRRGPVIADETGWRLLPTSCDAQGTCACYDGGLDPGNPLHAFRQWDMSVTLGGTTYTAHAALPDDAATSIMPWEPLSVATEYFFTPGRFRALLWQPEVLTDASPTWQPLDRWLLRDHDGSSRYFGFRVASYAGACAIEFSNDPAEQGAYPFGAAGFADTVFDLSSCAVSPTVVTSGATDLSYAGAILHGVVNANGFAGNAWFEYGPAPCDVAPCTSTTPQPVSGTADGAVSAAVSDADPGATLYFRLVAENAGGRTLGTLGTFSTPPVCTPVPRSDCAAADSATLTLKRTSDTSRQRLKLKGSDFGTPLDLGDPRATTAYAVCVYDAPAGGPRVVVDAAAPPGGTCGAKPCWRGVPAPYAFKYRDRELSPDGIKILQVKSPQNGKVAVKVTGGGAALPISTLPLSSPVTVQLQASNRDCWEARFGARIRSNDTEKFQARGDTP
jgi:hypothetical protein